MFSSNYIISGILISVFILLKIIKNVEVVKLFYNHPNIYYRTILINKLLLKEAGVLENNIFDSGICSVCNSKKVHSRRSDGENFGLGTTIVMKK